MQAIQNDTLVVRGKDYDLELTTCNVDDTEQIRYTTYGIRITDMNGIVQLKHKDISTSREFVESFIHLCVDNDASIIHIADLLEDYLD